MTKKHLSRPKATVRRVHRALADRGYDGPEPVFGPRWDWLFTARRQMPKRRAA